LISLNFKQTRMLFGRQDVLSEVVQGVTVVITAGTVKQIQWSFALKILGIIYSTFPNHNKMMFLGLNQVIDLQIYKHYN